MKGTSWHFCQVKENESTTCPWNISAVPITAHTLHAHSVSQKSPELYNTVNLHFSVDKLQFKYCCYLMVSKEMLSHCGNLLFRGMPHFVLTSLMTRSHFFSLFGCRYPAEGVLPCSRSTPSLPMLPTHGQVCVDTRRGGRGVLHAVYHNWLHWHDRIYQKTAHLNRLPLPLQA